MSTRWKGERLGGAVLVVCMVPVLAAGAAGAQPPDPVRGRALYENHCIGCHTPDIHSRPARGTPTRDEVRRIVEHWQRQQNLGWSAQDAEDVVEFLGRTRYKYPSAADRLGRAGEPRAPDGETYRDRSAHAALAAAPRPAAVSPFPPARGSAPPHNGRAR